MYLKEKRLKSAVSKSILQHRIGRRIEKFLCNCQTALQLANPTQLQLVGLGVDLVFPLEEEGITPT